MKNRSTFLCICIVALFLASELSYGQDTLQLTHSKVELLAKHHGDKVTLRWAPTDAKWWFYGIQQGYSVARRDVSDPYSEYVILQDSVLPWSPEMMEQWYVDHPEDEALILPLQTIHRDWENTRMESRDFEDLYERSLFFEQRFQTTILAADVYPIVANAAGLQFVDNSIEPDKVYSYRVRFNWGGYHEAYRVVQQWQIIDKPILHEVIEKEDAISISWDRKLHGQSYTAYYIERSVDGKEFVRLNEHPFVHGVSNDIPDQTYILYTDQVENYQLYYYRIIGIDPFGEESQPSEAVLAQGKDRTPPKVAVPLVQVSESGGSNKVIWNHDPLDELSQAVIYKKDYSEAPIIVFDSGLERDFRFEVEDNDVMEGMTDYFLVLVDTAGNYAQSTRASLYRKDKTPPGPPQNLQAEVDTSGRIILSWDQGPDNDVIGYYIFTADRAADNFIKLNQKKYPYRIYQDSVNMTLLTPKRFYKVAAIDKGGNIGAYSEILEVDRPDKIPPAPCLFYDYRVDSAGVFLGLIPSSSRDVASYRIYRKAESESEFKIIQTFDRNPPQIFLDDKLAPDTKYIYKWIAVDNAQLESSPENSTLHITSFDTRITYRPELRLQAEEEGVLVQIANTIPGSEYRIQIIRSYQGGKYRTVKTLEDVNEYIDNMNMDPDSLPVVAYRAKVLYKDGKRSKFSEEVTLE